ncbi:unnamed protein product [Toxocara canis]|uniref:Ovule protein n=1 Tax=Toxocara canis TaxID=6265 RepID=A0A183U5E2_TOXCA|nr:unnamed protein product [Toxocara canis]
MVELDVIQMTVKLKDISFARAAVMHSSPTRRIANRVYPKKVYEISRLVVDSISSFISLIFPFACFVSEC